VPVNIIDNTLEKISVTVFSGEVKRSNFRVRNEPQFLEVDFILFKEVKDKVIVAFDLIKNVFD
jgi:hypothetical protein